MLTLQFVQYSDIERMTTSQKIKHLLSIVQEGKIVLMQGRLKPEEETSLIQETMSRIRKEFKGIQLCTLYPEETNSHMLGKIRKELAKVLVGNREGITIIGPDSVIKEIRRDPSKIQLFTASDSLSGRKTTRKRSRK